MESFDPNKIADAKMTAIKEYRAAKRERDRTERLLDYQLDQTFINLKFNELKMSVEDRKARARTDESVITLRVELEKAQEKMDDKYAELERVITKIEFMLDANATNRQEMKLGNLVT
jgi:mevalonate kinase